jgi:hypothetical protein
MADIRRLTGLHSGERPFQRDDLGDRPRPFGSVDPRIEPAKVAVASRRLRG